MKEYSKATSESIEQIKKADDQKSIYKKLNTPFGYFGSKNKIAIQLCCELPPHYCWVEAFCGSAALTLAKPPSAIEIINDIDGDIVNVFKQLRNNHEELCKLVSLTPYSRLELENARIQNIDDSEIEQARKFLVQAMMAINGVFGKDRGGFSYSQSYSRNGKDARVNRWYNLPERLTKVVERLRNVRVENKDALKLMKMFLNRPATLVYLDPPYLSDRTNGYNNDANDKNFHIELLKLANVAKCMVFISGYKNDLYDRSLTKRKGWQRRTIKTITKDANGISHDRNEIIWVNKYYQKAQDSGIVPIKLTKNELKNKKLNPERK